MIRLFSPIPQLSVLIPHLPERATKLERLLTQIEAQNQYPFEVLIHDGEGTTGQKRNELIQAAYGEWVCQLDDDDGISVDFFDEIFRWLKPEVDCIGFITEVMVHGKKFPAYHCNKIETYHQFPQCFFRPITHTQVIRKSLCIPFENITRGEDIRFAKKMYSILKDKKGIFIPKILYHYDATHNHTETSPQII